MAENRPGRKERKSGHCADTRMSPLESTSQNAREQINETRTNAEPKAHRGHKHARHAEITMAIGETESQGQWLKRQIPEQKCPEPIPM